MCSVPIAVLILSIARMVENVDILKHVFLTIASIVFLACGIYMMVVLLNRKIVFGEDYIYIPNDVRKNNSLLRKIQHETTIHCDEIKSIYLALRCTDTNNKAIPHCVTPMINLIFLRQGDKEKVINLHSYSDKQIVYLLDYRHLKLSIVGYTKSIL